MEASGKAPRRRKTVSRTGGRQSDLDAVQVIPMVQNLLESYSRYSVALRAGVMEMNWRLATTESARAAFFVRRLQSLGLRRVSAQYSVLRDLFFAEGNCLSQNEIMRRRRVSSANVTRLIHRLERSGLVRREAVPTDKRASMVHLTSTGIAFCERVVPVIAKEQANIAGCFSDAEIQKLNSYLARFHFHVEQMAAEMTGRSAAMAQARLTKRRPRTTRGGTPGVH